jgi:predicted phosphodiesterase
MLAIIYDLHGNLPALEAVLQDIKKLKIDRFLLGGDYGVPSPWPMECLEMLRGLPNATWIRGNGERWLKEIPDFHEGLKKETEKFLKTFPKEEVEKLYNLPEKAEIDGVLYVHGSPKSDVESFAPKPQPDEDKMLVGVHDRTIVFGHSHQQFQRPGPKNTYLVNPGSAGMPLDGDRRGAWAIRNHDGKFEFKRTDYNWQRTAEAWRRLGGPMGEFVAKRIENGKDTAPLPT